MPAYDRTNKKLQTMKWVRNHDLIMKKNVPSYFCQSTINFGLLHNAQYTLGISTTYLYNYWNSYPIEAKANNSRASKGKSVLKFVRNRAVRVSVEEKKVLHTEPLNNTTYVHYWNKIIVDSRYTPGSVQQNSLCILLANEISWSIVQSRSSLGQ